jgi:hypothetical protein
MGTTPGLEAPIRNRARWRWNGWAAAMTVATATATSLLTGRLAAPARPAIIMPPAAPVTTELGPCPAVGSGDDRPVGTATVDRENLRQLDGETLVGATAAATRHGALATWTEDTIFHSSDDGQHFEPVLFGPGVVRAVAIDCHGRVFALRVLAPRDPDVEVAATVPVPMLLGVRHGTRDVWRSVDGFADDSRGPRLIADGGVVAVAGAAHGGMDEGLLAVSADAGASWRFDPLDVGGSWEGAAAMDADRRGVVRVHSRWGDCGREGSTLTRLDPATGTRTTTEIAVYPRGSSAFDGDGRIYGRGWSCDGLCTWLGEAEGRPVLGWPTPAAITAPDDDEEPELDLVGDGATVYAFEHGELYGLRGEHAHWAASDLPMTRALAVDAAGRVLGLTADDDLVRWSPRFGVRYLAGDAVD